MDKLELINIRNEDKRMDDILYIVIPAYNEEENIQNRKKGTGGFPGNK